MTHVDFCCGVLLRNFAAVLLLRTFVAQLCWGTLLHVCHGLLLSCATSFATQIATCSNMCNKLRKTLSADWSIVGLLFARPWFAVFSTLFYPPTSSNASIALISLFLNLLKTAPDNSTPAIKITSSFVSVEAMFVARIVAVAFWRGCWQICVAAASCATKVRNKSLRVSSG